MVLYNFISMRLKLILRNKATVLLMLLTVLIFAVLISSLYIHKEEAVKVQIGYVDRDQTDFSKAVIENVTHNELLSAREVGFNEGIRLLKDNEIEVLFVIKPSAKEKVYQGEMDQLLELHYISENYLPPLIGDVFVGEMLEEVCLITAMNYLETAMKGTADDRDLQEAYNYGKQLAKEKKEDYYVTVDYIDLEKGQAVEKQAIDRTLQYQQMILGVMLSFIAFYSLFTATHIIKDLDSGMTRKLGITKNGYVLQLIGDYVSMVLCTGILVVIGAVLCTYFGGNPQDFMAYFLLLGFFALSQCAMVLLIASLFRSISGYIVVSSAIVLILGIISGCFFNIDLLNPAIGRVARTIPANRVLSGLLDVIVMKEVPIGEVGGYCLFLTFIFLGLTLIIRHLHDQKLVP